MSVFFSWQSDTPARIGKDFLSGVLKDTVQQLKLQTSVEPARRGGLTAQAAEEEGREGSQGELRDLCKRIGASSALVADVTPLGESLKIVEPAQAGAARKFIDSDVAFEVGYASHVLGDRKVLLLFNAHYGWHHDLPANLRNRGGAIPFTLVPNASRPEIDAERKRLVAKLASVLSQSLNAAPGAAGSGAMSAGDAQRALYFQAGEVLGSSGNSGAGEIGYSFPADTLCYLRLSPLPPLERPLPLANLRKVVGRAPLLSRQPEGSLIGLNEHGAIAFEPATPPSRGPGNLASATQLFITGELWSMGSSLVARERGDRPQWLKLPFVSATVFERVYYDHLRALLQFALERLSLSAPWQVECGITGSRGLHLGISDKETSGPIVQPDVIVRRTLKAGSGAEMDAVLLEFFNVVHAAAGSERPPGQHGFPPGRPR